MAKLEIPIVVDVEAVEELLEELKRLQTYKLGAGDSLILVDRDDVVGIITMHLEAKQRKEREMVRMRGRWVDGQCSLCGCDIPAYIIDWKWQKDMDAKFCPNCGAYMGGDT